MKEEVAESFSSTKRSTAKRGGAAFGRDSRRKLSSWERGWGKKDFESWVPVRSAPLLTKTEQKDQFPTGEGLWDENQGRCRSTERGGKQSVKRVRIL